MSGMFSTIQVLPFSNRQVFRPPGINLNRPGFILTWWNCGISLNFLIMHIVPVMSKTNMDAWQLFTINMGRKCVGAIYL